VTALTELSVPSSPKQIAAYAEARSGEVTPMLALARQPYYVRWPAYYALVVVILIFGVFDSSPFIYFQF